MFDAIEDILVCLDEEDEYGCETNQHCTGMKELLRGIVAKDCKGADFNCIECEVLNKVLVDHAARYYCKCWLYRNECCNDEDKQKKRAVEWKENIEKHVEEKEPLAVKTFSRRHKIDIERSSVEKVKTWICSVKEMIRKAEKTPLNDARRFFSG